MTTIERIYAESLRHFEVTTEEFRSQTRLPSVTWCRECVALLARRHTEMSYPQIAAATGRANHTSVVMQFQRGTKRLKESEDFAVSVEWLSKSIVAENGRAKK